MNETTLEARVNAEIQKHFPSIAHLNITHQKHLTLQLGHRANIKIDGLKQAKAIGRLDILLSLDNKPLAILELKAPGEPLTEDDRTQGLSYAKLLTPQAPLVIVSNGEEAKFYQTYDGKIWNPTTKDEESVRALFSHALSSAANERKEAVRLLLGKQPYVWRTLFRRYTEAALSQLEGAVDDYTHPLTKDFIIERSIVSEICDSIINKESLLVLVGPPLSGKTNVLAQVCRASDSDKLIPIYIDAGSTSYGIFQHIANQFTRELYVQVQPSEIRQWIFHSIQSIDGHFVIIIDGWTSVVTGTLKEDIDELINILQSGQTLSVLMSMDDTVFTETKNISGRPTCSAIGRNAKVIQLNPLNDNEFESARSLFNDQFLACFHPGAQFNLDFRIPRFLRLIASWVNKSENKAVVDKDYSQIKVIPSVTNFLVFESWNQYISHPGLESFFQDLAKAYILDKGNRIDNPTLTLMSHGKGHIVRATAEKVLGHDKISTLLLQGHVEIVRGPHGKVLVLPKMPEFLAAAASYVIADDCLSVKNFDDAYAMLVEESESFPYGDLVGARALLEISKRDYDLANNFIFKLLNDEPERSRLSEGSRALMYFEDVGEVNVYFGKGTSELVIGNIHPWNILSHFAAVDSADPQLMIMATIGSYPKILIRPYPAPIKQTPGFHVHDISEHGSVLCHKSGIIEPITYAMQCGFYHIPEDMLRLCLFAKENNLFFLAHRLNMAAISTETCVDKAVAHASEKAQKILRPVVRDMIENVHVEAQQLGKKVSKIGRNEPCPCGSGKKYKKCCGR
ncbi:MAG: SEC-C metal-binding domain-containing protein [Candidatus Brocadiales bacterium]|nr:SEC-C metal-binding domain-containing protein [Candidatus Brocadiales bacterium]